MTLSDLKSQLQAVTPVISRHFDMIPTIVLVQTVVMEPEMTLSILKDVAAGMNFLHHCEPPMVHQELQSSKVLLDSNCRALLSDVVSQPVSDSCGAASANGLLTFPRNSNCWALLSAYVAAIAVDSPSDVMCSTPWSSRGCPQCLLKRF